MNNENKPLTAAEEFSRSLAKSISDGLFSKGEKITLTRDNTSLHLEGNGDLWLDPKDRYCYPMKQNAATFIIFQFLAQSRKDQESIYFRTLTLTNRIYTQLPGRNCDENLTRGTIKQLKKKIKRLLSLNDVIEGKSGSGYRINPKYEMYM